MDFCLLVSLVSLLGLSVEGRALFDQAEALDVECQACGIDGGDPRALLAVRGTPLGDELASLVLSLRRLHRFFGLHGWQCYNVEEGSEPTILSPVPMPDTSSTIVTHIRARLLR